MTPAVLTGAWRHRVSRARLVELVAEGRLVSRSSLREAAWIEETRSLWSSYNASEALRAEGRDGARAACREAVIERLGAMALGPLGGYEVEVRGAGRVR